MSQDIENTKCKQTVFMEKTNPPNKPLMLEKSQRIYQFTYESFINWTQQRNEYNFTENVMLEYFTHLANKVKSSSLWAKYSMIKSELKRKHNISIEKYTKLTAYLKEQNKGYKPKTSKVLTEKQFNDFLENAPNRTYLVTKVILIFGISGACHCEELTQITVNDIEDLGKIILVKIPNALKKKSRTFTIIGNLYGNIYREYAALRPTNLNTTRFFLKYQDGRCHRSVIGKNKIALIPRIVASYLKFPNPNEYTGHCFRRTSETFFLNNGRDFSTLKKRRRRRKVSPTNYAEDSSSCTENNDNEDIEEPRKRPNTLVENPEQKIPKTVEIEETTCSTVHTDNEDSETSRERQPTPIEYPEQKVFINTEPIIQRTDYLVSNDPFNTCIDESEMFGRSLTLEFRQLEPRQQIFAKKAIQDILFEARLGTLNRHSVVINGNNS